jgi:hypothetical protein
MIEETAKEEAKAAKRACAGRKADYARLHSRQGLQDGSRRTGRDRRSWARRLRFRSDATLRLIGVRRVFGIAEFKRELIHERTN